MPLIRGHFDLLTVPDDAVVRSTFLGIGKLRINGVIVGDEVLEPGWQSYTHRLVYRVHQVADLLRIGENVIEAEVAPGWFSGRIGFFGQRDVYGAHRAVIAQLDIFEDGRWRTVAATDETWTWQPGPTLSAELYDGETYDARIAADSDRVAAPAPVDTVDYDLDLLEERAAPPVRRIRTLRPTRIFTSPSGKTLVDFGRNIVGWARIRVSGPEGTEVRLQHAEVLENGELGTRPLRSAKATDRYVLAGTGPEEWEPSFTYHGFRYLQVDGWPTGDVRVEDLEAVVISTDLRRTGWFRTSFEPLAQLHRNVVASTEGNFVSIPTDCPQRDERLGWTGDVAVFAPTAEYLFDSSEFLRSWLADVALEQRANGAIPNFVPEIPFPPGSEKIHGQFGDIHPAVWGDAITLVPWAVYNSTGDPRYLAHVYESMCNWVDGVAQVAGPGYIRREGFQFGDWLDPVAPPEDPAGGSTDPALVATAYFAHSARLVADAAQVLGRVDDEARYRTLADAVRAAFRAEFVDATGRMTSHSQTAYAIALRLGLLETPKQIDGAGQALAELVRAGGHVIGTGFVGTPLVLDALTDAGEIDDAYRLLLNEERPSWLYAVSLGATTIWERWDSMLPDGSINPGEMTSFNHFAFGAVADWLHRTVAGLQPAAPGWERIRIAPRPRLPLRDAGATHLTPFGEASLDWEVSGGHLNMQVTVPPGTVAEVDLEGIEPYELGQGVHSLSVTAPATYVEVAEVG
ncbi:hypothetical protein AS029_07780 [Microbacterium enclense]|nr:hypothetical protein AS029_07780 [Microbacterium enclense]